MTIIILFSFSTKNQYFNFNILFVHWKIKSSHIKFSLVDLLYSIKSIFLISVNLNWFCFLNKWRFFFFVFLSQKHIHVQVGNSFVLCINVFFFSQSFYFVIIDTSLGFKLWHNLFCFHTYIRIKSRKKYHHASTINFVRNVFFNRRIEK